MKFNFPIIIIDEDFRSENASGHGIRDLAEAIERTWNGAPERRYVVFTGGEPLLQLDPTLLAAVHAKGFEIAVETNGTLEPPAGIDWVCVSPKAGAPWILAGPGARGRRRRRLKGAALAAAARQLQSGLPGIAAARDGPAPAHVESRWRP